MDIVGDRGIIDLGISKNMTLAEAWRDRRPRNHRNATMNQIEAELLSKRQMMTSTPDVVLWRGKNNIYRPRFTTKETWDQIRIKANEVSWHKGIWFVQATPKFSFCSWLAVQNRLATGDRLLK